MASSSGRGARTVGAVLVREKNEGGAIPPLVSVRGPTTASSTRISPCFTSTASPSSRS